MWLPLAATVFVIRLLLVIMDRTILLIPYDYRPENVLGFSIPGFGIVVGIFILLVTGMLAANLFGRRLVSFWESILGRIPLVRTVYTGVKQVVETLFTTNNKSFRKVVLIEYPRKEIWCMGFLTNKGLGVASKVAGQELLSVFVPTTPNPTSGFIVMLPVNDVVELGLSVEDGFKYIISMGVVIPDDHTKERLIQDKLA